MDLDTALAFLEKHAQNYVLYLLRFFSHKSAALAPTDDVSGGPGKEIDAALFTYATISLALGAALQQVFIAGTGLHQLDLAERGLLEASFWLAMSLTAYALLQVLRTEADFADVMAAVLQVFPPAFLAGAFAAYAGAGLQTALLVFWKIDLPDPKGALATTDLAVQAALLLVYLPSALGRAAKGRILRAWIAGAAIIALVLVIDVVTVFGPRAVAAIEAQKHAGAAGHPSKTQP